ncbi:MAG: tetratricopeptide repeat protein [Crocinitomicaceae bacterium]|nr:tetratricopeptide repeat protein [Crocinitomicaceae bacterium]
MRNLIVLIIAIVPFFSSQNMSYGQESRYLDSMQLLLKGSNDRDRAELFTELSAHYKTRNSDSALYFGEQALIISRRIKDDELIATSLNAIGIVYNDQGKYHQALDVFLDALDYSQKANNLNRMARINNNIGIIYYHQKDFDQALDHFQKTAHMLIKDGDTLGAIYAFNNIGGIYLKLEKPAEGMAYFQRGYKLAKQFNSRPSEAILLTGIATVHSMEGQFDLALEKFLEALEIKRNGTNKGTIVYSLESIGETYNRLGQSHMAIFYFEEMLELTKETGMIHKQRDAYFKLSETYELAGNYSKALLSLQNYNGIRDSLESIASEEALAEIQSKYDKVKDQKKIELLEKNEQIRQVEIERKETWNILLVGGGVGMVLIAFLIYGRLRTSRNQNKIIQNQKQLVDEKNKEIIDSINYARYIQQAMLGAENTEGESLPEHFIFFQPKDIVSGDFYWTMQKKDHFYVAAVDCTGHGVPGAFLTLLGSAFINEIVSRDKNIAPATILNELRLKIINELGQKEFGTTKDGMDISLIKVYRNNFKAEWAGANNPLWIFRSETNEIEEIKGDKEHIGYSYEMTPFTNHTIQLNPGDQFFLFSDGYADQFGIDEVGREKKFKAKRLKELLVQTAHKPCGEQLFILQETFETWKGNLEQLDDVCIIGVRI